MTELQTPKKQLYARDRLFAEIRHFVSLQQELVTTLSTLHNLPPHVLSGKFPRQGNLTLKSEEWRYQVHGAGILFIHSTTKVKVDVSDHLQAPELFSLWRLVWYFGSLRRTGVKMIEKALGRQGEALEKALAELLPILEEAGKIEQVQFIVSDSDGHLHKHGTFYQITQQAKLPN
ncbi:MAG: hypothetical protein CL920_32050 [Deltaproteobacteria bacterium]|mgnify:CR=1|nr:hypothetical protein [Deltaproteobacteria bacterium]MBU53354.1 hypothetical protein [Deltaproteobacteria bacterium]|tara:strand:+ start:5442 stop:5966 length:525 start_codon:yes stop_codon:yes gene_type:complete